MKKKVKNLTSNLLLCLALVTQLAGMESDRGSKLTWGYEDDVQKDGDRLNVPEGAFYTEHGLSFLDAHLNEKPESSSNYKALDVADDRTKEQRRLKVITLLNAQHKQQNDPRGSLLQKVMCSPAALRSWHKMLCIKPSLHREGWSAEADKGLACSLLAATKLHVLLKNQYLMKVVEPPVIAQDVDYWEQRISPNQQYFFAKVNNCDAALVDLTTQEQLYLYEHVWDKSLHRTLKRVDKICGFSADNRFCFFIEKISKKLDYQWTNVCSLRAFDLKTKHLIKAPECVKQFSPHCAFAVVHNDSEQNQTRVQTVFDVEKQEIVATYPCPRWYKDASFSPDERWCFLYTDMGLKLFDLENNYKEIDLPTDQFDGEYGDIIWHSNSTCFITKQCNYHVDVDKLCQECSQGTICERGEEYVSYCVLYDPATHTELDFFQDVLLSPPPAHSPDGRYCYFVHTNKTGRLYDLQEQKTVKLFKNVRQNVDGEWQISALFSEDPQYPYCIIPIRNKHGHDRFCAPGLTVIVYDLEQQGEVPEVSNLENACVAEWPAQGPYYCVMYSNEIPENFHSDFYPSVEVRNKETHECVLRADNAQLLQGSSPDGNHCVIGDNNERALLVDMANKKVVRKFGNGGFAGKFLNNGTLYEEKHSTLHQVLPPDPDWGQITTQQILCILYAYRQWQQDKPLDLTKEDEQPLCNLFESLDTSMQTYVAKACKIKKK